jgi:hypothetical protein
LSGNGDAVKNLAEALQGEGLKYKLSLCWEVKTEILVKKISNAHIFEAVIPGLRSRTAEKALRKHSKKDKLP